MSNILQFPSRADISSQENLDNFIYFCKNKLTYFSPDFNWDDNYWPRPHVIFNKANQSATRSMAQEDILGKPLLDFSKAYIRYHLGIKNNPRVRYEFNIFQYIELALLESGEKTDILMLTPVILDRAIEIARERHSHSSMYHIGRQLQFLASFVSNQNLIPNYIDWKNPIPRPNDRIGTGAKSEKEREEKLPNEAALNALAEVFASNPTDPEDIFVTSTCVIMLSVPCRISEVMSLHVNCEVYEKRRDGSEAYGIRFSPAKGAAPQIKWVPSTMVSLAQEAIKRLKTMTAEARKIASWYESNTDRFYRHTDCPAVEDDVYLTIQQREQAIGYVVHAFVRNKISTLSGMHKELIKKLPKDFPYFDQDRGIKFSQALFCLQYNQIAPRQKTSKVQIYRPDASNLLERVSRVQEGRDSNFFDKHNYKNSDGTSIKLTTHQFRRLLNTMAQRGGLSQIEIARWSGRTSVQQNRVYDYMSEFEIVDMLRQHDSELTLSSNLEELRLEISKKLPISRQEFNTLAIPSAHITEIGYCIHDYAMSPCQKHMDCFNCNEQVCVKGDIRLKNIQDVYDKNKVLVKKMEEDIAAGIAGADRWYEHTKMSLQRAEQLLQILNDPSVPNGSIIKLYNPHEFSPTRRAIEQHNLDARITKDKDKDKDMLHQLRILFDE